MDTKEILKFCIEKGLLLDEEVLNLFGDTDLNSAKIILETLKNQTQKKIITKKLFIENKEGVSRILSNIPSSDQGNLEKLKIKLGINIQISKEFSREVKPEFEIGQLDNSEVKILSGEVPVGKKFNLADFTTYFKNRFLETRNILQEHSELDNLVSINKLSGNRQGVSLIGMVSKNKLLAFLKPERLAGKTINILCSSKISPVKGLKALILKTRSSSSSILIGNS